MFVTCVVPSRIHDADLPLGRGDYFFLRLLVTTVVHFPPTRNRTSGGHHRTRHPTITISSHHHDPLPPSEVTLPNLDVLTTNHRNCSLLVCGSFHKEPSFVPSVQATFFARGSKRIGSTMVKAEALRKKAISGDKNQLGLRNKLSEEHSFCEGSCTATQNLPRPHSASG